MHLAMTEPALFDLVRELEPATRRRDPELEVDIEVLDDCLLDPWFLRTEAEIAQIEDDPTAKIHEIRIGQLPEDYGTGFEDSCWAF
jgi:hypothetical protein